MGARMCKCHVKPILSVRCDVCSVTVRATPADNGLCVACIREHALANPTHTLVHFPPSSKFLREALVALMPNAVPAISSAAEPVSIDPGHAASPNAAQTSAQASPLVVCARNRVLAIQAGLDALAANIETALLQLEANRDAALAAIQSGDMPTVGTASVQEAFTSGVDKVHAAAAAKRAGLETEGVAADATLGEAIDATTSIAEAAAVLDDAALVLHAPALIARFAAAQAAVAAIPERPATSSFLVVEPATGPGALHTVATRLLGALALVWTVEPHVGLSPEQAAQLFAWLPPSDSPSPCAWVEVYRATTHGFGAAAFHARCDGRPRLLVLARAREGGWLFGGFTALGFKPPNGYYADPSAFLFSLTNSLGRPEKLESKGTGHDLYYNPSHSAYFGGLFITCDADTRAGSWTETGWVYAEPTSTGAHPMARGTQKDWLAAEVVAWVV